MGIVIYKKFILRNYLIYTQSIMFIALRSKDLFFYLSADSQHMIFRCLKYLVLVNQSGESIVTLWVCDTPVGVDHAVREWPLSWNRSLFHERTWLASPRLDIRPVLKLADIYVCPIFNVLPRFSFYYRRLFLQPATENYVSFQSNISLILTSYHLVNMVGPTIPSSRQKRGKDQDH